MKVITLIFEVIILKYCVKIVSAGGSKAVQIMCALCNDNDPKYNCLTQRGIALLNFRKCKTHYTGCKHSIRLHSTNYNGMSIPIFINQFNCIRNCFREKERISTNVTFDYCCTGDKCLTEIKLEEEGYKKSVKKVVSILGVCHKCSDANSNGINECKEKSKWDLETKTAEYKPVYCRLSYHNNSDGYTMKLGTNCKSTDLICCMASTHPCNKPGANLLDGRGYLRYKNTNYVTQCHIGNNLTTSQLVSTHRVNCALNTMFCMTSRYREGDTEWLYTMNCDNTCKVISEEGYENICCDTNNCNNIQGDIEFTKLKIKHGKLRATTTEDYIPFSMKNIDNKRFDTKDDKIDSISNYKFTMIITSLVFMAFVIIALFAFMSDQISKQRKKMINYNIDMINMQNDDTSMDNVEFHQEEPQHADLKNSVSNSK